MAKSKLEILVTAITDKAVAAMQKLSKATGDVGDKGKDTGGKLGFLDGVMLSAGGMALNMATNLAKSIPEMIGLGIASDQAKLALTGYAGSSAEAEKYTIAVGNAANGTISEMDAMQNASRLLAMGLATNTNEASKLTEMAITLGSSMGKGPKQAFEDFTLMLANQSIPRLDTFGISASKVRERMEELAEENENLDRQTRFMIATMEIGEEKLDLLGEAGFEAGTDIDRLTANIDDLKVELGKKLAPVATGVAGDILRLFKDMEEQNKALTLSVAQTTHSYEEWFQTLHPTLRFWANVIPSLDEYLKTQVYLNAELEQGALALDIWSLRLTDAYFTIGEAEEAIRDYAGELDTLSEIVDNKVGQAYDRFIEKQGDMNESIDETESKILEVGMADYITPDQLKQLEDVTADIEYWEGWVTKLKDQIYEYNRMPYLTDLQKAELAQAQRDLEEVNRNIEMDQRSIEGLNDLKMATEDQNNQMDTLTEKLGEQEQAVIDLKDEYDLQTQKMLYNMLAQKLAASDVGEDIQVNLLNKVATGFGLMNDAQVAATSGMIEAIGAIGKDGDVTATYDMIMDMAGLPTEKTFKWKFDFEYNVQDIQSLSGLGFQHGGSFVVGGQGIDQTPVSFMATRGERVTITPPGAKSSEDRNIANISMVDVSPVAMTGGYDYGEYQHGGSFVVGGQGIDQTPVSFAAIRGEQLNIIPPGGKSGGGRNINIYFSGPVYGDQHQLERMILPIVEKGIRADKARS